MNEKIVCIMGLGYIGLALARAFAGEINVVGYDTCTTRVNELIRENHKNILFTDDPGYIDTADYIIICVPTLIDSLKKPDLTAVKEAAHAVGCRMKKGAVVILESTVYPGATEEVVKPLLECSGLRCGSDFKLAYCPERINPGDDDHSIEKVVKVISGMDEETAFIVADLYYLASPVIYIAKSIMVAEAAKIIENIQRDLNIALVNELSIIFNRLGISTKEALAAASTKWNFTRYTPGLVGGRCIPVAPYYLVHKAKEAGCNPRLILSGRAVNDSMPQYVVDTVCEALTEAGKNLRVSSVLVIGLAYKENVGDVRATPAHAIIEQLQFKGLMVVVYDPLVKGWPGINKAESLEALKDIDAVIITVGHDQLKGITLDKLKGIMSVDPVLFDVRSLFERDGAIKRGFKYLSL